MHLELIDWILIGLLFATVIGVGLSYTKQAGKDLDHFFLGGRNLPWYIAGVSMIATTFAADTPLAVTELVGKSGISGNWLWWNMLAGGMLTTFFFARLWRRAGVLTEVELIELRYSGPEAAFLRGFKAVYLGLFLNVLIIGWVNLALVSILEVFFEIPKETALMYTALAMVFVAIYSSLSGLLGVAMTDAIQFVVAMIGCIVLSVLVLQSEEIGGVAGLKEKLPEGALNFFPTIGSGADGLTSFTIGVGTFLAFAGVQWWASWYPGAEPGGGGYIAQRMMSAKNEKHAVFATLFFQIGHYCVRPWPWIIVALCALVLYPELGPEDKKLGFIMAMKDFLPPGLKGLLLAAFFAAYMSTISTQLNWGASYLVNDIYLRFIKPEAAIPRQMLVSRLATILLMLIGLGVTSMITTIAGVWTFIIECGAGLGLVLILRWYWWRINVWSEITATIVPFIVYGVAHGLLGWEYPDSFFLTVGITTVAWILVTYLTPPTDSQTLAAFYNKVQPGGFWGNFQHGQVQGIGWLVLCWLSAILMTYAALFGLGKLIFAEWMEAGIFVAVGITAYLGLRYGLSKTNILS